MARFHITDIEAALNHWRARAPATAAAALSPPASALAGIYARMALARTTAIDESQLPSTALQAWLAWYATTPDTPCIAICSTSQGDDCCKGCGRTFTEVQHWLGYSPAEKRSVWQRITQEGKAWRFHRYAERADNLAAVP